jgi:hypothetical protein
LQFNEEIINYTGLAANPRLGFVIDIKAIKAVAGQMTLVDIGWTYLPIYEQLENENGSSSLYCNSGLHAVIIICYIIISIASLIRWSSTKGFDHVCCLESQSSQSFEKR